MIAEAEAYKLLSTDKGFNDLLDKIRGKKFGNGFKQGIFTYDIPEKPSSLARVDLAPLVRVDLISISPFEYSDDNRICLEHRILINFWCKSAKDSEEIGNLVDEILEKNGFDRYTSNENPRYKDPDIDLLCNVRKYRYFEWTTQKEEDK